MFQMMQKYKEMWHGKIPESVLPKKLCWELIVKWVEKKTSHSFSFSIVGNFKIYIQFWTTGSHGKFMDCLKKYLLYLHM